MGIGTVAGIGSGSGSARNSTRNVSDLVPALRAVPVPVHALVEVAEAVPVAGAVPEPITFVKGFISWVQDWINHLTITGNASKKERMRAERER